MSDEPKCGLSKDCETPSESCLKNAVDVLMVDQEICDLAKETLKKALRATRMSYHENFQAAGVEVPDWGTRLEAVKIVLQE